MRTLALIVCGLLCAACNPSASSSASAAHSESAQSASTPAPQPFHTVASIKEIMITMIDPAADGVWDSVGTTISRKGIEVRQPKNDAEWQEVRANTLRLIEATNLLQMSNRRLVPPGGHIEDEGADGVLSTQEAEALLQSDHATFAQMARALGEVGIKMLDAVDRRQTDQITEIGEQMDEVCEACHTRFWYPRQTTFSISQGAESRSTAPKK